MCVCVCVFVCERRSLTLRRGPIGQGFKTPVRRVAMATKLFTVTHNISGSSVWNFMSLFWRLEIRGDIDFEEFVCHW